MRVVTSPQKLSRKVESGKMSPEFLREHCRKHDLYMIPHFNTILYLHHKVTCFNLHPLTLIKGLPRNRKSRRIYRTQMLVFRK